MTVRKRTTQKTGNGSRRTTTLSSTGGKTVSYSNKPTKQSPRRTVSFNHKTGRTRTTYSQKLGGGFTRITSKTTGPKKYKSSRSSSRSSSGSGDMGAFFGLVIFSLLLLSPIMYIWPVTIYFIVGIILAIVSIVVLVYIIFLVLPWVIWGSILYGLYNLMKLML